MTQLNDLQLVQQVIIPAVLLAAQCMLALERYEDCLGLLEGLVATEEGAFASLAISSGRQVHVRVTEENSSRMLGLNPVTGMKDYYSYILNYILSYDKNF